MSPRGLLIIRKQPLRWYLKVSSTRASSKMGNSPGRSQTQGAKCSRMVNMWKDNGTRSWVALTDSNSLVTSIKERTKCQPTSRTSSTPHLRAAQKPWTTRWVQTQIWTRAIRGFHKASKPKSGTKPSFSPKTIAFRAWSRSLGARTTVHSYTS